MSKVSRKEVREKKKVRIKKKITGTPAKPRLCVYRSAKHIYAQVIDDSEGKTLASASTIDKGFVADDKDDKKAKATKVGKMLAERALEKGITEIVFDRNGYIYHGRVKALSEGARKAGLVF